MLDNFRTRTGKFLVVFLAMLAVTLFVTYSDAIVGADADGQTTVITGTQNAKVGAGVAGSRHSRNRKTDAKGAKSDSDPADSVVDYKTSTTITGTTFDEQGNVLKDVKITVRKAGRVDPLKTATSNEQGIYAIDSLPAETYDVLASHEKFVALIRPSFTIFPHDNSVQVDFHLPLGAEIKGKVVNEEGENLKGVRVAARKMQSKESRETGQVIQDDSTYQTRITDPEGAFALAGIAMGNNVFEFFVPGYAMERMTVDINPEKAAEEMKVTLKRTGIIAGRVVNENNQPVAKAAVSLTRYKPLQSAAQSIDKDKIKVETDEKGLFKFEKLYNEGYYDLIVEEPQFAPGIYPLVPVNTDRVVCQLGTGGEISGLTKLIDREASEVSALIKATAVIKGTTYTQEATSDGKGKFTFKKLPYGSYALKVDDGKFVSEPLAEIAAEKDKPAPADVVLELYQTAKAGGRVVDSASDMSVPNAKVTLNATYGFDKARTKTFNITTDGHGLFEFDKLPAGIHAAFADARGYLNGNTEKARQNFVLVPGERKGDLNIYLDHGGSVEGFVLSPDGRSVADVEIQLFAATQFNGKVDPAKLTGKTDGTGYFKIWGIEVGERVQLYASASKKGYTKTRSELIELTPKMMNQVTQINLEKGGQVSGIVTDKNKMPIPGAQVQFASHAFPGDPSPSTITVHTEPNGTYVVDGCPAGGAGITVSRAGFVKQGRGVTVRNEQRSDNINFELEAGQTIAGVVEDLEGYPIAGAKVKATGINGAAGSEEDTTNKKGEFELKNLGKGFFKLDATFQLTTPEGPQNYHFTNPKVESGTVFATIDCDLSNMTSGKVKGEKGRGVPNFTITLNSKTDTKPSQDFVFNLGRPMKDAAGYFRFSKLPRGLYKMTVNADGYEPYVDEEVAIGPHRRTVLSDIRLNPAGGVVGRVFSSTSDRPVNNASVKLESVGDLANEKQKVITGNTNMRGEFRLNTVPEGTYRVHVDHPSYIVMKMEMIHVTEKRERDLGKLYLEPGGAVRGTVVNHFGDPMPNMKVTIKGVTPAKHTTTDAAGNYLIQGVQFGRWPIVVEGSLSNRNIYSFQTSDVHRDETERLDFTVETTSHLSGRLLASGESGIQSANVKIHPFDENNTVLENIHYDANAKSNQFDINEVPPGQYFLWAAGQGAKSSFSAWKQVFLNRGQNRTDVEIASSKVQGKVTDASGTPVPNVGVQMFPLFNNPNLTRGLYNKLIRPSVSGEDGSFTFENLQPGSYQLVNQTSSGTGWYAQPIFRLANGQQIQGLNVLVND